MQLVKISNAKCLLQPALVVRKLESLAFLRKWFQHHQRLRYLTILTFQH